LITCTIAANPCNAPVRNVLNLEDLFIRGSCYLFIELMYQVFLVSDSLRFKVQKTTGFL
jgi:hypothetical protein